MTMAELVYVLCSATSLFCAALLFRSYLRQRSRLLLWSTLCFLGLGVNSVVLFVDLAVLPSIDLRPVRTTAALISMLLMTIGLVWESR
jgi:hypothetical protein